MDCSSTTDPGAGTVWPRRLPMAAMVLLVTAATVIGDASAPGQMVVAEGWSAIIDENRARARDMARLDAYRVALETAGVNIGSRTDVHKGAVVYDNILAATNGHIRNWEELRTWETPDGMLHVEISAEVAHGPVSRDTSALAFLIDIMGNPRIAVIASGPEGFEAVTREVETKLAGCLSALRYHVVDLQTSRQANMRHALLAALQDHDMQTTVELVNRLGADLLVETVVDCVPETVGLRLGGEQASFLHLMLSAKVTVAATGKLVNAASHRTTGPIAGEVDAAAVGTALSMAGGVVEKLSDDLIVTLPRYYLGPRQGVWKELTISGLEGTSRPIQEIVDALRQMRFVSEVRLRRYSRGLLLVDILTANDLLEVVEYLERASDLSLTVREMEYARAAVVVSEQAGSNRQ